MMLLKTLLGALALCAALLVWGSYAIGPGLPAADATSGLTAATVLASDGITPDGRPGEATRDRAGSGRLAGARSIQDALAAQKPAG
ncbi:hypothetical protein [Methylobacterium sp. NEAU K]|uniref:hypothetical protein n=1 Tax=Methylobacterium sp. NEAU K TaxID=3064946 RepID=UPI002733E3CB|nr:hypothetical protein [Methylobacterium sp. NEAU K]MDP4002032.1 hypothetical protein [Methylobacterium sp. NEAU K]